MKKSKLCKSILSAAAILTVATTLSTTALAAPEDTLETTLPVTSDETKPAIGETKAPDDEKDDAIAKQTTIDYFQDPFYDTEGNATLIANRQIIFSSSQLQFISVTTKDGHVFYVVIDYTDTTGNNVYFLNKVDDFDLYSLLHSDDAQSGTALNNYMAQTTMSANAQAQGDGNTSVTTVQPQAEKPTTSTAKKNTIASAIFSKENIIIFSLILVAAAAMGVYAFLKMRGNKKQIQDNDDFIEDDEINEDAEDDTL